MFQYLLAANINHILPKKRKFLQGYPPPKKYTYSSTFFYIRYHYQYTHIFFPQHSPIKHKPINYIFKNSQLPKIIDRIRHRSLCCNISIRFMMSLNNHTLNKNLSKIYIYINIICINIISSTISIIS